MTLDQARRIIDNPGITPQADWSIAGRIIANHYRDNPHLLKPVTFNDGPRRPETTRDVLQSIHGIGADLQRQSAKLQRGLRGLTRDAALELDPRGNGVPADPTVGPERIMKLKPPGTAYSVLTEADGDVWLCRHAQVEGSGDNGRTTIPTSTGDRARDRHAAITAQRDRGAAFAAAFNERERKRWGQQQ